MGCKVSACRFAPYVRRYAAAITLISHDVYLSREFRAVVVCPWEANFNARGANYCHEDRVGKVARDRCPLACFRDLQVTRKGHEGLVHFGFGRHWVHTKIYTSCASLMFASIVRFSASRVDVVSCVIVHCGVSVFQSSRSKARSRSFEDLRLALLATTSTVSGGVAGRVVRQVAGNGHLDL